jgi:KUP system potassium uptake protein
MLGILGLIQVAKHPEVLKHLTLLYNLLSTSGRVFVLGFVLCTTGAEALYSTWAMAEEKIFGSVGFS